MYVQDKVEEYADEIFERLDNGAHIYFCGLKVDITFNSSDRCIYDIISWCIIIPDAIHTRAAFRGTHAPDRKIFLTVIHVSRCCCAHDRVNAKWLQEDGKCQKNWSLHER